MTPDNPLYRFRYCPLCGSSEFVVNGPTSRHCRTCGFTYYTNPKGATVAVIVNDQDEMLVARRGKEPALGTRDLVGGFIDLDETAEEAMCREICEESGLEVHPDQLHYLFSQHNRYPFSGIVCRTIDLFFEIHVTGRPLLRAQDDVASLEWIPLSSLHPSDFGLKSVSLGVARYLKMRGLSNSQDFERVV